MSQDLTDLAPEFAERREHLESILPGAQPGAIDALLVENYLDGKIGATAAVADMVSQIAVAPPAVRKNPDLPIGWAQELMRAPQLPADRSDREAVKQWLDDAESYLDLVERNQQSIPHHNPEGTMSTSTLERPALVAPAYSSNGTQMREYIDEGHKVGFGDRLKSAPRRMRAWIRSTWEALRFSSVGQAAGRGLSGLRRALGAVWARTGIGAIVNGIGALLTCQRGRRIVRKAVYTVARVVTAPFRFLGRMVGKVLNKFGWGRKVVSTVSRNYAKATSFLSRKFEGAMSWLDRKENTLGMSILRGAFQGAFLQGLIKLNVPAKYSGATATAAGLFVPEVGTPNPRPALFFRAVHAVKALGREIKGSDSKAAVENATAYDANGLAHDAVVFTDPDGTRMAVVNGTAYEADSLGDGFTFTSPQVAEAIALSAQRAEVESVAAHLQAVASNNGTAPVNRAEKRAAAKAHGPRK